MANSTTNIDTIAQSQASKEVTANAFFDASSQATIYGRRSSTCSGLTWGFYGGNMTITAGTLAAISNGTLALTANTTNYIVASKSTGALSTSTATTNWNDTVGYWCIYSVVTGASTVSSYTDYRENGKYSSNGPAGPSSVVANTSTAALKITQTGTGNAIEIEDVASDTTPFIVDQNGRVVAGFGAFVPMAYADSPIFSAISSASRNALGSYSADIYAPVLELNKSRNAAVGSHTVVVSGDYLGTFRFAGSDGTVFRVAAQIEAYVDGTPGASDMPGRLVFSTTPDGSVTPLERMRIDKDGGLSLNKTRTAGGATGAQTINKPTGSVNFAATNTTLVVTNSLVTVESIILATIGTNDATMKSVVALAAAGSFTLTANAAATAETRVNFLVLS